MIPVVIIMYHWHLPALPIPYQAKCSYVVRCTWKLHIQHWKRFMICRAFGLEHFCKPWSLRNICNNYWLEKKFFPLRVRAEEHPQDPPIVIPLPTLIWMSIKINMKQGVRLEKVDAFVFWELLTLLAVTFNEIKLAVLKSRVGWHQLVIL